MVLSDISIRRPVLATVMNLVVLLIGLICYDRLAVRLIPNVDVPVVTVATSYSGANAQVIESQITKPVEDALSGIEGIDYIQLDQPRRKERDHHPLQAWTATRTPPRQRRPRPRLASPRPVLPNEDRRTGDRAEVRRPTRGALIWVVFYSPTNTTSSLVTEIADIANRLVKDRAAGAAGRRQGPGLLRATRYYAMRIWLDPDAPRRRTA